MEKAVTKTRSTRRYAERVLTLGIKSPCEKQKRSNVKDVHFAWSLREGFKHRGEGG